MDGKLNNNSFFILSDRDKESLILEKLYKYLPDFVDRKSETLQAFLLAIAKMLVRFYNAMYNLKDANWTGKGLRKLANSYRIFYKNSDSDNVIQTDLINRFNILTKRGTKQGVEYDISRIDTEFSPRITWHDDAGWIVDITYPETDRLAYLDTDKSVEINVNYPIQLGSAILGVAVLGADYTMYIEPHKEDIRKIIIPLHVTVIYK